MSEGVRATAVSSSEGSPTTKTRCTSNTLSTTLDSGSDGTESSTPPSSPTLPRGNTTKNTVTVRKHKKQVFHHNRYNLYDGKKIRSALIHKKWPPKPRRVSFPTGDNDLVTGYLEPANPWEHAENVNIEDLISSYKKSCEQHSTEPLQNVVSQLEKLDISDDERCAELCMKNESLDRYNCEPLEEILKRVQFEKIDLEAASLDDESAVILFDMTEYYQSARHLNMSNNRNIGSRGWQACAHMIKKTTCLEQLEARDITLTQQHMNILKRPLQLVSHLHILKLENCGLAGRAFAMLVSALKMNTGLKELYLADNGLEQEDAIQLGALLRVNNHLQLLDISNNHIKDEGARDLLDGLITQSSEDRRGRGLSILILWNNDFTKSASAYFAQAIDQSITLETLNIGKNAVGNELLEWSEASLVKSNTLLQLGMQSTSVTCKGALVLAEIIEKNRTLQRIDLRDNNIQMEGLTALSFAMKRNKTITQMDLDDKPWSTTPATMHQYLDLVSEIRGYCVRNDEPTSTDDSTEESSSPQHRSRLSSVSSRKISLTCQTLPRSPPSMTPTPNEIANRAMLEPKRTSGRLRSPAPSPIPSPVASPIPSPSRGRFVVSRVSEASLSSTNSSASSSPITPPSLASSPTCFFPSAGGGSSRFRVVTVVESAAPAAKSVVTSTNANVTIGFNYRVQTPESNDSDDSDSVFRSDVEEDHRVAGNESSASIDIDVSFDEETRNVANVKSPKRDASLEQLKITKNDEDTTAKISKEEPTKIEDNQTVRAAIEEVKRIENGEKTNNDGMVVENCVKGCTQESRILEIEDSTKMESVESTVIIETKVHSEKKTEEALRDEIITSFQSEPKKAEPVQRQASSLEKLLGLFQHPGSIFSGGSFAEKTEVKNSLQDGVTSMLALGDKFQQYLREGRGTARPGTDDSPNHVPLQRSVSDASRSTIKLDPVKSLSIPTLSCIEAAFTRDFASFNEGSKNLPGISAMSVQPDPSIAESTNSASRRSFADEESPASSCAKIEDEEIPRISDDLLLPENAHSTAETIAKDGEAISQVSPERRDSSSTDNANNAASSVVAECKNTICAPKLKDIPEYSVLEIRELLVETGTSDESSSRSNVDNRPDGDDAETKCDSSTTDSINDPSFKNSSHCKITCDISGDDDVHTLGSTDDVHNFFNSPLSHDGESRLEAPDERAMISASSSEIPDFNEEMYSMENKRPGNTTNSDRNIEDSTTKKNIADDGATETSKHVRAFVANNVNSSLPVLDNSCPYDNPIETKGIDARGNGVPGSTDNTTIVPEAVEYADTVEEFLPIDATVAAIASVVESTVSGHRPAASVQTRNSTKNDSYDNDSVNMDNRETDLVNSVDSEEKNASRPINHESTTISGTNRNISITDQTAVAEAVTITERVTMPQENCLSNEYSVNRIEIASAEDDELIAAAFEQISTSLSEDSDYSSKLSVDDAKIGEPRSIDSTANSPAHDGIDGIIAETSAKTAEHRSFARVAVETVLNSILTVTETHGRIDSAEIKNSESTEDLMFKMTDITTDVSASISEIISGVVTAAVECRESSSLPDDLLEPGQSSRSPTNLFIDKPGKIHRNSQDSGIEETTVSISEDSGLEVTCQPRESFQESVDSGIDSECSSVCARVDVGADVQKERARDPGKAKNVELAVENEIRDSSTSSATTEEILAVDEIPRIVNEPDYKSVIEDEKSSAKLMEVIGADRSTETTTGRSNVVVSSTSPE